MFSPVPLINRIDRLKESENRITLDDIWDYPVRPQRFSMWTGQPPHQHPTPSLRPAARDILRPVPSSPLPPSATGLKELDPRAKPCRISAQHHTRATLRSALRFAETYGSASPSCVLVRRPAQYRRLSPITSRTPRGPQKAGPCDARPSSLKWRIPVYHEDGEQEVGVVPSIVVTAPDDKGDVVCSSSSDSSAEGESTRRTGGQGSRSATSTLGTATGKNEGDVRVQYLRRTTTRILGPEKLDLFPCFPGRDIHPNYAPSRPFDNSSNLGYTAPKTEDFTLPEDYASTFRLSIIRCPRRKRAWRVVERCLEGFWRRVGW